MIKNAVESAKYKLAQHRSLGENSNLSIFQVARLMDTVRAGEAKASQEQNSIFFSLN